jgi:hypothetical protein
MVLVELHPLKNDHAEFGYFLPIVICSDLWKQNFKSYVLLHLGMVQKRRRIYTDVRHDIGSSFFGIVTVKQVTLQPIITFISQKKIDNLIARKKKKPFIIMSQQNDYEPLVGANSTQDPAIRRRALTSPG